MMSRAASAIRALRASEAEVPERNLLATVRAGGDEAAFEELVRRHGPMVFRVCLRALGHRQDAEDAFQAVFVVLLRRAGRITKPDSLASWLHGVAFRVSQELLAMRRRRQQAEAARPRPAADPTCPVEQDDLAAWLDAALADLPPRYRDPVVLCELQGRSRKDVARELGVPEGTLSSRLAKARKLLAGRLEGKGLPAAALGALLGAESRAAVPAALAERTVRVLVGSSLGGAAASVVPGAVNRIADGVVKAMIVTKLKGVAAVGAVFLGLVGLVAVGGSFGGTGPTPATKPDTKQPADADALVRQLGDAKFARREEAQKQLLELGLKARPALRAGAASKDAEVARRARDILAVVRQEQIWAVFSRIAGDDRAARDLFAQIMGSPRAVATLEVALDDPTRVDELYRVAPPVLVGDVAGWLLLGALQPGTSAWSQDTRPGWQDRQSSVIPFLPEDDFTSATPIHGAYTAANAAPLKKLTAAWLAKRRENDGLQAGLTLALRYDIADAVTAARKVLNDPKPQAIRPCNLAAAAILVGLHGTKADLPLLARHAADDRMHQIIIDLDYLMQRARSFGGSGLIPPQPMDGRDLFCQVRDAAAAAMCKLAGKNPADFGFPSFPATKHADGRLMSLPWLTAVGFKAKADRAAAFGKAAAWLAEQKSKAGPPVAPKPSFESK